MLFVRERGTWEPMISSGTLAVNICPTGCFLSLHDGTKLKASKCLDVLIFYDFHGITSRNNKLKTPKQCNCTTLGVPQSEINRLPTHRLLFGASFGNLSDLSTFRPLLYLWDNHNHRQPQEILKKWPKTRYYMHKFWSSYYMHRNIDINRLRA